jgi:hypothetical protein
VPRAKSGSWFASQAIRFALPSMTSSWLSSEAGAWSATGAWLWVAIS